MKTILVQYEVDVIKQALKNAYNALQSGNKNERATALFQVESALRRLEQAENTSS